MVDAHAYYTLQEKTAPELELLKTLGPTKAEPDDRIEALNTGQQDETGDEEVDTGEEQPTDWQCMFANLKVKGLRYKRKSGVSPMQVIYGLEGESSTNRRLRRDVRQRCSGHLMARRRCQYASHWQ